MKVPVKILRILTATLTVILIALMAFGTVYEKSHGSDAAIAQVYHHPVTVLLWALELALVTVLVFSQRRQVRLWGWLQWASVLLIFAGALLTNFTGRSGVLKLAPHQPSDQYDDGKGGTLALPFTVSLDTFEVVTYPGTKAPMDFVATVQMSDLQQPTVISMNNIGQHHHYRFYMSDYDDSGGIELMVSRDPWGVAVRACQIPFGERI